MKTIEEIRKTEEYKIGYKVGLYRGLSFMALLSVAIAWIVF